MQASERQVNAASERHANDSLARYEFALYDLHAERLIVCHNVIIVLQPSHRYGRSSN